jgi:hypothetical protein
MMVKPPGARTQSDNRLPFHALQFGITKTTSSVWNGKDGCRLFGGRAASVMQLSNLFLHFQFGIIKQLQVYVESSTTRLSIIEIISPNTVLRITKCNGKAKLYLSLSRIKSTVSVYNTTYFVRSLARVLKQSRLTEATVHVIYREGNLNYDS